MTCFQLVTVSFRFQEFLGFMLHVWLGYKYLHWKRKISKIIMLNSLIFKYFSSPMNGSSKQNWIFNCKLYFGLKIENLLLRHTFVNTYITITTIWLLITIKHFSSPFCGMLGYSFFIRKQFFCLSLNFLNIMLEIRLRFS